MREANSVVIADGFLLLDLQLFAEVHMRCLALCCWLSLP